MGPIYSNRGCMTCKRRKKKCGEEKPICQSCARLNIRCSYRGKPSRRINSSSPTTVVRALPAHTFRSPTEEAVLSRMQGTVIAFYMPSCIGKFRDLSVLWQMMFEDDLVGSALIASLGVAMGITPYGGEQNCLTYGRALKLLRDRVKSQEPSRKHAMVLRTSVGFLSTLDLLGPRRSSDIFLHWKGLLKLLSYNGSDIVEEASHLNTNINILILELLIWSTSCYALFYHDVHSICTMWQEAKIIERLESINSDNSIRIPRSPLLVGEYQMHKLILEVTCLLRSIFNSEIDPISITSLKSAVCSVGHSFETRFADHTPLGVSSRQQQVILEIHRSIRASLFICLIVLEGDSEKARDEIDSKVQENIERFLNFSMVPMNLVHYAWSLEILVCSIRRDDDFDKFESRLRDFEAWLAPGTYNELNLVKTSVQKLRTKTKAVSHQRRGRRQMPEFLPVGLSLLSRPNGILSEVTE